MKKMLISLVFFLFSMQVTHANDAFSIPDDLTVREHWISMTKSYDIETKTHKLGTLYRRFFSFVTTYDFYDPMDVKTATAKARFFSFGAYLDIYDQNDILIGGVEEKIFNFFPTFEVIGPDSSTKLARAEMNFWGTKFYIYDPATHQEMAVMSRSFFRMKNDWTIKVTNRSLLEQKNIDSRVLMTVLAVQGEIEDWKNNGSLLSVKSAKAEHTQSNQIETITQQITTLKASQKLGNVEEASQKSMEALTDELEQGFLSENPSIASEHHSNQEQVQAFTAYCLKQAQSQNLSDDKKKAILTLLNIRLSGHK